MTSRNRRSSEDISIKIQELIVNNNLQPGAMLPSIERLSKQLGVSKGTVREALVGLESIGLVDIQQGKGTMVAKQEISDLFRTISHYSLAQGIGLTEIVEVRLAIETMTAKLAAQRATAKEIDTLVALNVDMRAAISTSDYSKFNTLDSEFHNVIAKSSRNELLAEILIFVREMQDMVVDKAHIKRNAERVVKLNDEVISSLRERDEDSASQVMVRNIKLLDNEESGQDVLLYCDGLGTGSIGGSFYTLGQKIAKLIGRSTTIKPTVHATGGGVDNVRLTQDKQMVLAISQADVAVDAFKGEGEFDVECRDLRVLCCLPSLELQICALESSGIRKLEDLRGKTVAVGAYGGATARVSKKVLNYCGFHPEIDYQAQMYPITEAVEKLRTGLVDALFVLSIGQSSALVELGCQEPLRFLSLDSQLIDDLINKHSFWLTSNIEANTYPGQVKEIRTIGVPSVLICHKQLGEDEAYKIISAILENPDEISMLVYPRRPYSLQAAAVEIGVPRHPGAQKYLQEKISL